MRVVRNLVFSALIIAAATAAVWLIFETEPEAQQMDAVAESAMLVETTGVEHGTFRPTIRALGTVEAAVELTLAARVSGYVDEVSPDFEPGSLVTAEELLVELDRDDFRGIVEQRESAVVEARAEVRLEEGRQDVARNDLERYAEGLGDLDDPSGDGDRDLMLRGPQEDVAEARLDAAEEALRQARRDLERTRIRAPWDGLVLTREVNVGSQVGAGEPMGRLVGTDAYWVIATVPPSQLSWLVFADAPGAGAEGDPTLSAEAGVRDRAAWPAGASREARLLRPIGALEEGTRLARILVEVPDPLARADENAGAPALLLGSFVEVTLRARPLADVIRIDRQLLRDGDTVWLMEDDVLRIREVAVAFRDPDFAYVSEGLRPDDRVVVTNLATVVDGAPLRLAGSDQGSEQGSGEGTGSGSGATP